MPNDPRLDQLSRWIHTIKPNATLAPASADASFRRYFRVSDGDQSYIAMDAPPEKEDLGPFLDVAQRMTDTAVNIPAINQQQLAQGFLLMDDLGNTPYLTDLKDDTADSLYGDAIAAMVKFQLADTDSLPRYDEQLLGDELELMPTWFMGKHLGIHLSESERHTIDTVFQHLIQSALEQPQVFVHRDYHSRNLMITPEHNPGIIDFQDAVLGPICYDLVSLLRDCYIAWPEQRVYRWVNDYRLKAIQAGLVKSTLTQAQMIEWFDLIGLQRHIKVLGIFARLSHRDGKSNYLNDLPLTLSYVMTVAKRYPTTAPLIELFERYQIPEKVGTVELSA